LGGWKARGTIVEREGRSEGVAGRTVEEVMLWDLDWVL
jgi:hypothetical protein